jgi:BlaI family transcriptional regulator, penicillinase repressor
MGGYIMTESEYNFAELIWNNEPIASGNLVKLCEQEFGWKKSTTYTVLKKLCVNKILRNEETIVTAIVKRDDYKQIKSTEFVEDYFEGSLPQFITAFIGKKKLTKKQIEEIRRIIDGFEEEQ